MPSSNLPSRSESPPPTSPASVAAGAAASVTVAAAITAGGAEPPAFCRIGLRRGFEARRSLLNQTLLGIRVYIYMYVLNIYIYIYFIKTYDFYNSRIREIIEMEPSRNDCGSEFGNRLMEE